ncbi:MAG TPA: alpha/beta hydrolase [Gemmatimonadota bacterium]|nr:alpha/beta hydrolase [Gemmatimonadota bacterium]
MPTTTVDGQPIRFDDTGGDGPAVLFAHGFLMDRTMFGPQVEALAPDFRCVSFDERGFGGTPVRGPFDYWDLAEDAVGLLDHLGVETAVLAGMSQGGFLALRAALRHPDRLRGLVLIDTDAGVDDEETREGYRQMFRTWREQGPIGPIVETLADLILGQDPELRAAWIERWRAIDPEALEHPVACLLDRDDLTGRLDEIACPVLVVHGEDDESIPIGRAEAVARALPDCRGLVRVPGAMHAPVLSHPGVVNPPLRSFLEEVTGTAA